MADLRESHAPNKFMQAHYDFTSGRRKLLIGSHQLQPTKVIAFQAELMYLNLNPPSLRLLDYKFILTRSPQ